MKINMDRQLSGIIILNPPLYTRLLRLYVSVYQGPEPCMKLSVYACPEHVAHTEGTIAWKACSLLKPDDFLYQYIRAAQVDNNTFNTLLDMMFTFKVSVVQLACIQLETWMPHLKWHWCVTMPVYHYTLWAQVTIPTWVRMRGQFLPSNFTCTSQHAD